MALCVSISYLPMGEGYGYAEVVTPLYLSEGEECPSMVLLVAAELVEIKAAMGAASAPGGSPDALPPAEDIAAAWGVGFVLVVGCFVLGRMAGAVLSMLK